MRAFALLPIAMVLILFVSCSDDDDNSITGSGNLITTSYDLTDFEGVSASTGFDVTIAKADTFSVMITTDDNILQFVDVELVGSTLVVKVKDNSDLDDVTLKADITMPRIQSYSGYAGSKGMIKTGFSSTNPFVCSLSAGSTLYASLQAGNAAFNLSAGSSATGVYVFSDCQFILSSGSNADISGSTVSLNAASDAGSNLDLLEMLARNADVIATAGSTISVTVVDSLAITATGGSTVYYQGTPELTYRNVTSDSKVVQVGG